MGIVVHFKQHPFEGTVRPLVRTTNGKLMLILYRKGYSPVRSKMHRTWGEAFECLQAKCIKMNLEAPAISHKRSVESGVEIIHQLSGTFRYGHPKSSLFESSSSAWQSYAKRQRCQYKLWTADEVDTLIQLNAPERVLNLYKDVRFSVQRADIARFFILYHYGGLYADLDTFPNLEKFPLVPLGLCRTLARVGRQTEWETELVVATLLPVPHLAFRPAVACAAAAAFLAQ